MGVIKGDTRSLDSSSYRIIKGVELRIKIIRV